ncbi:hypothetical protein [Streptomyces sp. RPA4-5]|uniref:hypothetical protein n=1 Tax=Streptomyces sp. RPA4-5 TaxID=2721245 RepID=UPI002001DEE3|nr:hypothetical protein [Streptomyces sp. RPA4-5]
MPHPSRPDRTRARTARRWCADFAMGARFAVTGGREGWIRTALSALGVGLGVVVLLLASAVPNALNAAMSRQSARTVVPVAHGTGPSDRSLLTVSSYSDYRELPLYGRILAAEGRTRPSRRACPGCRAPASWPSPPLSRTCCPRPRARCSRAASRSCGSPPPSATRASPTPVNSCSTKAAPPCRGPGPSPATGSSGSPRSGGTTHRSGPVPSWC